MPPNQIFVVMPTYNEESVIEEVVTDWIRTMRGIHHLEKFTLCVIDDGSQDGTFRKLEQLTKNYNELRLIQSNHQGHSASCMRGYREALKIGASWVLQIDSDGQCDPKDFQKLWSSRDGNEVIFGFRRRRSDGLARRVISLALSVEILVLTGRWVKDANVPFRLISAKQLSMNLQNLPAGTKWCNIHSAILFTRMNRIKWVEISFLRRKKGKSKLNFKNLLSCALDLAVNLQFPSNSGNLYSQKGTNLN